jgi:transposase
MRKSRFAWAVPRRLIEDFVSGSTARTAASLVGVNKNTAALYFHRLREIIAQESEEAALLFGEIEVDESYFGGHRKGKRAADKVPVFGAFKARWQGLCQGHPQREGTDVEGHHRRQGCARLDRLLRHAPDTLSSYNVLDVSSFKHFRINHSKLFSDQKNHINGIENFWNQAKRHMRRFNGVPKDHFHVTQKQQPQLIQWDKQHIK